MTGGLSQQDLQVISEVFQKYPDVNKAILFGSRAKGNYENGSDVDIALKGNQISDVATSIAGLLNDESPLPYHFDIIDYNSLANEDLKQHIDRVGIEIYSGFH